ncbi:NPP1 protein [Phytophthora nicotianae]|uniref:NPP1 protein n=1 Tax=Phytophthora nicotianae TaxID=4792 RepID=A0A0W8BZR8_PHYNI|nr:NPP1 protein [Phytophthora nicotianae]
MTGRALLSGLAIQSWAKPKILGVSLSKNDKKHHKDVHLQPSYFAGGQIPDSSTSLRFIYDVNSFVTHLSFSRFDGNYQDLIMWEQLTDAVRVALNGSNKFGRAEVPFSDEHYQDHLHNAWPLQLYETNARNERSTAPS